MWIYLAASVIYISFTIVKTTPSLKDLYRHITPQFAQDWKVIGTLLSLPSAALDIIEEENHYKARKCCNAMLKEWLQKDTTASWEKLFNVIESTAVSCSAPDKAPPLTPKFDQLTNTGAEQACAVAMLSSRVSEINVQTRFIVDDESWPPEQPTSFTPLLLIHRQGGHCTPEQVRAIAKLTCTGKVAMVMGQPTDKLTGDEDTSRATKEITEILSPLETSTEPAFILIEGAPGIGKSDLLKEIAYRWGKKQLLQKFELVLLVCLRDPSLQQLKSVNDLLRLFCKGYENEYATQIVNACAQYLLDNGGKTLTLLLDGYDEYPEHLRENSLVTSIRKRQVLPHCGLVVSSRPHASQHLRKQATIRVDIYGFTETERKNYIKQALPGRPHKIEELIQYLHKQPSVDSICFIPFNMVMLLYLYKLGNPLPSNAAELYNYFICSTICRHLCKYGKPLTHDITDLTDLPGPYNGIIRQLSKLSLEAFNDNKLTFTLDEITAACPDIAATPGAINGFGLLQAVQHFGLYTKTVTLNFIHFTVQEFLAAYYISHLPPDEELKVIEANFWNNTHFNVFSIYITITKGQRSSFKTFLSDGNEAITIADRFLEDQLKCLHLYRCFKEAGNHTLCNIIDTAYTFYHREISLGYTTLTNSDMECLSLFLTSSLNKEWKMLDLNTCYMQDKGLNILHRGLRHGSDVIISTLWLRDNGLTTQSSSLISELTVKCQVKVLGIIGNYTIGEDWQLYSMLTNPSSVLEVLNMWRIQLSSSAAIDLFAALKKNNKLKELNISNNAVTDDACNAITKALEMNSCLVKLGMHGNPLSSEAVLNIVRCLKMNNTLQILGLPECPQAIQQNLSRSLQEVNKKRESRGCRVKLEINFSLVLK